jgi:hypothetical protein
MLLTGQTRSFPRDLLDESGETVRMAERIVRQLGFTDLDVGATIAPTGLTERLAWAIRAMEDEDVLDP